jgi:hypothetical protein
MQNFLIKKQYQVPTYSSINVLFKFIPELLKKKKKNLKMNAFIYENCLQYSEKNKESS